MADWEEREVGNVLSFTAFVTNETSNDSVSASAWVVAMSVCYRDRIRGQQVELTVLGEQP